MKNLKYILFICLFSILNNLKADVSENPVTFKLLDNFYSDVIEKYENNTTVFYYTNNLLSMNLTDNQLKTILKQKPGEGSSKLAYYETLNIKVKPVEGTNFESLQNTTTFYRANGGGSWVNSIEHNQDMESTAKVFNLDNNFWPWGFRIQYRKNITDEFTNNIPNDVDLANKTLEEQLATLLNLDLEDNSDAVVEQYKNSWRFNPLPNNYTFLLRFDFFDKKDNISPQLKEGTSDEYLTSSLKLLDTKYVAIRYDRTGELPVGLIMEETKNTKNFVLLSIPLVIIILTIYLLKRNKII